VASVFGAGARNLSLLHAILLVGLRRQRAVHMLPFPAFSFVLSDKSVALARSITDPRDALTCLGSFRLFSLLYDDAL